MLIAIFQHVSGLKAHARATEAYAVQTFPNLKTADTTPLDCCANAAKSRRRAGTISRCITTFRSRSESFDVRRTCTCELCKDSWTGWGGPLEVGGHLEAVEGAVEAVPVVVLWCNMWCVNIPMLSCPV